MPASTSRSLPPQGLYDGQHEHDACGVAFVADMHGRRTHSIVADALTALHNLDHRGASGAEINTGDGAGILIQVPDAFLREVVDFELPPPARTPSAWSSCPTTPRQIAKAIDAIERIVGEEDLRVLGWRDVPTDSSSLGATALSVMPQFRQLFVAGHARRDRAWRSSGGRSALRKRVEREAGVYLPSLSCRTHRSTRACSRPTSCREFFPDLHRRAVRLRDRAGALALLDQHVPVVAAGASLPLRRPQRRDQHRAWATATGCAPARRCWPATSSPAT